MASERPAYAIGNGYVQHREGQRLDREECERIRDYLRGQIANPSRSDDSHHWLKTRLTELDAAITASFPTQQKEAAE